MSRNINHPKSRKAAGGNRTASSPKKHPNHNDVASHAQRQKLLSALRKGSITTLEARRELDILHPAARIQELRQRGHYIITYMEDRFTDCGQKHRVASYVMLREAKL